MFEKLLNKLAGTPWFARQLTKWTAYAGGVIAPLLASLQVEVEGETVDLLTANQEAAIVAGAVAILAATVEGVMSYAAKKAAGAK